VKNSPRSLVTSQRLTSHLSPTHTFCGCLGSGSGIVGFGGWVTQRCALSPNQLPTLLPISERLQTGWTAANRQVTTCDDRCTVRPDSVSCQSALRNSTTTPERQYLGRKLPDTIAISCARTTPLDAMRGDNAEALGANALKRPDELSSRYTRQFEALF